MIVLGVGDLTARQPKGDDASGLTKTNTADWHKMPQELKNASNAATVAGGGAVVAVLRAAAAKAMRNIHCALC